MRKTSLDVFLPVLVSQVYIVFAGEIVNIQKLKEVVNFSPCDEGNVSPTTELNECFSSAIIFDFGYYDSLQSSV
ncbi:EF-hand calcium-binding domain-containing protein 11 [Frankliniella fusca]|uniref:EF-hand calcium-binding domain-containing protein 11 n=1 Tax=Frankliniella fusca TaxID=407009 RepID=A0AAE1HH90_9NEOP|nr:EF-hand calcium-binding domain-containing protein 11 [Frankliniella fusca]